MRTWVLASVLLAACSQISNPEQVGPTGPTIRQLSLEDRSTNVGVRPMAAFAVEDRSPAPTITVDALVAELTADAGYFLQDGGERVAALSIELIPGDQFRIAPEAPLGADSAYELRLSAPASARFVPLSWFGEPTVRFSTGSSPVVLSLVRPIVPGKSDVSVTFSEPVSVTEAAFYAGTTKLPGCVIMTDVCTTDEAAGFTFRFSSPPGSPPQVTLFHVIGVAEGQPFRIELPIGDWMPFGADAQITR